jgi:hypothetical protein
MLPEPVVISTSGVPETVSVRENDPFASNAAAVWVSTIATENNSTAGEAFLMVNLIKFLA